VLAALFERESSGVGQRVDTSMLLAITAQDCWNWLTRTIAVAYPDAFVAKPRADERGVPNGRLAFQFLVGVTKDGRWLQFCQNSDRSWATFLETLGLGWMNDDPEWRDVPNSAESSRREQLWTRMLDAARQRTFAEWWAVFDAEPNLFAEEFP